MVASDHEESLRVRDFESIEVENDLARKLASVNIVAEEEILRCVRFATYIKQVEQIVILTMDVATD